MVAALAAMDAGLEPLIVEKQSLVGGSTGLSGGMVWLPDNPLMQAAGVADSLEDGLAYFDDVVGDIGPASSPARRETFLRAGVEMIDFLQRAGVRMVRCPGWSDYYPNSKGGNAAGRSVEGVPFDAAALGPWRNRVQPSMAKNYGFVLKTNELRSVQYFNRSPRAFAVATRVFLRTRAARLRNREILTNGASLIGQILKALIDLGDGDLRVWTDAALDDLIVEGGRVVGARVTRDGATLNVASAPRSAARRGRLRPQRRHAATVRRRPAQRGQVVDRQRRGHRRGAADGDAPRRQDRPARRGVVAAHGVHRRSVRRVAGVRASAARRHLRRRDRPTVLQRVELLRGGRQGHVRPRRRAVLAGVRSRVRQPIRVGRQPVSEASRSRSVDRQGSDQARRHAGRPRPADRCPRRRSDADGGAFQRVRRQGVSIPTSDVGSPPTTSASATPGIDRTRHSAPSTALRTSPPGSFPATSERAAA